VSPGPRLVLVVSAASGAGKTTLLERLVPLLRTSGLRVGVVKRTHHDVDPDPPGKDSRRLRDAGAAPVALQGPARTTIVAPTPADAPDGGLDTVVAAMTALSPLDLVLVEGGREVPARPRIEVVAPGGRVVSDPATLVAVVADADVAPPGVPRFARDDVAGLAALLGTGAGMRPPAPRSRAADRVD
jgi:molybdopterin-guanine dinucleotide biosynthesis protein B